MVTPEKKRVIHRMPLFTLALVMISFSLSFSPAIKSAFIYDREAILCGEVWRLITAHFVHLSTSHLFYGIVCLGVVGWIIEARRYPYFSWICILSAVNIGMVLLLFEPGMYFYGGMSGIIYAAVLYLCLMGLHASGPRRLISLITIVAALFKIFFEFCSREPIFASQGSFPFEVVPLAHAAGALTALGAYMWCQKGKKIDGSCFL